MKFIKKIAILVILCAYYNAQATPVFSENLQQLLHQDEVFSEANGLYEKKDYEKAIVLFSKLNNNKSEYRIQAIKKIALSYAALEDIEQASFFLEAYLKNEYDTSFIYHDGFFHIKNTKEFTAVTQKYIPSFNFWTLLYLYFALIGIFVAIVINLKKEIDKAANLLMGLYVLLHSLFLTNLILFLTHFELEFPHSYSATVTFTLLFGPLLYFYFKRTVENYTFKIKDALHLLPFVIMVILVMPIYLLPEDIKLFHLLNPGQRASVLLVLVMLTRVASLSIYAFYTYKIYLRNKSPDKSANTKNKGIAWQRNIIIFNTIYVIVYVFYATGIILSRLNKSISMEYFVYIHGLTMCILISYISFMAYVRPNIFSLKINLINSSLNKYKNSGLTPALSNELRLDLIQLLNENKIYKENNITLDILSQKLGTTRHNASQIINEHFQINFFELINRFRIEEAKELLERDSFRNLNIISIAYEVGYNNKVTFNKAFKKETGLTPTQYITEFNKKKSVKTA